MARVLGSKIQIAAVAELSLINWLGETVAVNRSTNFKVFSEIAPALERLEVENVDLA